MPFSMWTRRAREAAEAEFGKQHYKQLVFIRRLPFFLATGLLVTVAYGVHELVKYTPETWYKYILIALVIFVMVVLKLTVFKKRYKIPRRPGTHWWSRW